MTARELQKAQNRVRAVFVFGLQSNLQRSQRLAEHELYFGNAEIIREEYGVRWVRLTLNKKGAVRGASDVGVIIERGERF